MISPKKHNVALVTLSSFDQQLPIIKYWTYRVYCVYYRGGCCSKPIPEEFEDVASSFKQLKNELINGAPRKRYKKTDKGDVVTEESGPLLSSIQHLHEAVEVFGKVIIFDYVLNGILTEVIVYHNFLKKKKNGKTCAACY